MTGQGVPPTTTMLLATLDLAVPLLMQQLADAPLGLLLEIARQSSQVIAEKGDVIQYRAAGTRVATAALIRGLAAAALVAEDGVTFSGRHWCRYHADCVGAGAIA